MYIYMYLIQFIRICEFFFIYFFFHGLAFFDKCLVFAEFSFEDLTVNHFLWRWHSSLKIAFFIICIKCRILATCAI